MNTLYVMVGAPGCGKSTYIRNHLANIPVVSRDQIRFSIINSGDSYFKNEKAVFRTFIQNIVSHLTVGDVIADATHLNKFSRQKLVNAINRVYQNEYSICFIYMNTPLDVCLSRNAMREGLERVPDTAIREMYGNLTKPDISQYINATLKEIDYEGTEV